MRSHSGGYEIMNYLLRFAICGARSSYVDLLLLRISTGNDIYLFI
jgi:hypothetical protein